MDYRQHFIFLIDDTGFNKKENMADSLKDEVATNCVALIQSPFVNQVEGIMDALVQDLSKRFGGATEFHFTEIYNHTGAFEKIEFEETLEIIQMFNDLLKIFDIEIVTSTLNSTKDQTTENIKDFLKVFCKDSLHLPTDKINGEKSVALLNSIFTAKKYLEENYEDPVVDLIVCDEGLRKAGFKTSLMLFDQQTPITFERSKDNKLLQIADYSAWYVTRVKNTLGDKTSLNENAIKLMSVLSEGREMFVNLKQATVNPNNFNYQNIYDQLTK